MPPGKQVTFVKLIFSLLNGVRCVFDTDQIFFRSPLGADALTISTPFGMPHKSNQADHSRLVP